MGEFWKLATSAFLGVVAGLLVQWWKSQRDELRILCDEFCRVTEDAANLASRYWLHLGGDEDAASEARLVGLQARLTGYRVLVRDLMGQQHCNSLDEAIVGLFDALTGGPFKSGTRGLDPDRANAAQYQASLVVLAIRTGFYEAVGFHAAVVRYKDRFFLLASKCRKAVREHRHWQ